MNKFIKHDHLININQMTHYFHSLEGLKKFKPEMKDDLYGIGDSVLERVEESDTDHAGGGGDAAAEAAAIAGGLDDAMGDLGAERVEDVFSSSSSCSSSSSSSPSTSASSPSIVRSISKTSVSSGDSVEPIVFSGSSSSKKGSSN